ncbi:SRPBCC family protein [Streptomyces sp. NPDC018029]|uniref:SRPBCC family protein n=1 Tax=Streptomyces sp. NPDC018029 TaxID=3365032 RepID=UPI0037A0D368
MEHEVFVPVSAERLRQVLADPERVAGAVPGLQRDAEETAGPISGRLKVRVGGHTITYRGSARTAARADGTYTVEGEGAEVRGSGAVRLTLTVRLVPAAEGATLVFDGGATADGRITEGSPQAVESAVRRLLDRFAEGLGAAAPPDTAPSDDIDDADDADEFDDIDDADDGINLDDTNVLDEVDGIEDLEDLEELERLEHLDNVDDIGDIDVPPAEAAHARRTMIGRSAEEVDHAPPRGRYAPTPAPESLTANATLRWAAPAAALALASAIVVGRALRRRR